jgi:lipoate-protein ligase B
MKSVDFRLLAYRDAWDKQEQAHAEVLAGSPEQLLLVEHPPVITFGRRAELEGQKNLLAAKPMLDELGVEIVQSDRGGDVTFHGPGQLVVYPIIRLADHGLSVGGYVRLLQETVINVLREIGIESHRDEAIGVWIGEAEKVEKICAVGVRVRRGITMHGLALNVTTDLRYFNLIVPCGIANRGVTSIQKILGDQTPPMQRVKQIMVSSFDSRLAAMRAVR